MATNGVCVCRMFVSPLKIGQSRVVWWEMVKGYRLQLTSTQLGVCAVWWGDNRGSTTHTLWLILVSISQLLLGSVGEMEGPR